MSIMSDIQDEIMKPVKLGFYVGSAVLVVGGLAIAANSKPGRKFITKVGAAVTRKQNDKTKKLENKKAEVIIDVEAESVTEIPRKIENQPKGSNNV